MQLVKDAKKWYRMLSVQLSILGAAMSATWLVLPREDQVALLDLVGVNGPALLVLVNFVAVVWGRLKAQKGFEG